jgi:hypothetical protein
MQKILHKEQISICPKVTIDQIERISIFDEIKFSNDLHRIKFIELSSEVENNFMMLAIDGTIYKYDLASKELLFSFKSQAFKSMKLYDGDTNMLAADSQ